MAAQHPSSLVEWAGGERVALAIVFTDIVGGTRLGTELGDIHMKAVKAEHYAVAARIISERNGRFIKTIGDAVLAVFKSVTEAFEFACAFKADPGPSELRGRVRVGIHAGEVDVKVADHTAPDISGSEVDFAARVVGAIKDSEVWVSAPTKAAILRRLHADQREKLLWGEHKDVLFKGFEKEPPVTLWALLQLTAPAPEEPVTRPVGTVTAPRRTAAIAKGLRQIGYVGVAHRPVVEEFRRGLAAYGHIESLTIQTHYRWSEGDYSRYPDLLRELIELPVELIVADATPAVAAAKRATRSIPIVMVGVGDPVAYNIVPSLMRPSGNITGLSNGLHEDLPRGLRLFKEILPEATRVAILAPPASNHPGIGPGVKSVEDVAHLLGMIPRVYSASTADELRATVASIDRGTDVLVVVPDHGFAMNRSVILEGASALKIPVLCPSPEYVPDGALMSLGPNRTELYRRLAYFVDAILKGAQPSALPVEEPSKQWLLINLKTAAALGISMPGPILMRADELIE